MHFLKKSGMDRLNLLKVYYSVLLPSAEYCSVVYGPLIPLYVSEGLEAVQRRAMKIIYGTGVDYEEMVRSGGIVSLKDRREKRSLQFALKAADDPRFGSRRFVRNGTEREARTTTRRTYMEENYRTERAKNNPLQFMIIQLNTHYINI